MVWCKMLGCCNSTSLLPSTVVGDLLFGLQLHSRLNTKASYVQVTPELPATVSRNRLRQLFFCILSSLNRFTRGANGRSIAFVRCFVYDAARYRLFLLFFVRCFSRSSETLLAQSLLHAIEIGHTVSTSETDFIYADKNRL